MKILSLITHPHVIPNPIQVKIFLVKSYNFLTLHRQQWTYHVKESMWHQVQLLFYEATKILFVHKERAVVISWMHSGDWPKIDFFFLNKVTIFVSFMHKKIFL